MTSEQARHRHDGPTAPPSDAGVLDRVEIFESLFASSPSGLAVFDADVRPVLANRAYRELVGSDALPADSRLELTAASSGRGGWSGLGDLVAAALDGSTKISPELWLSPRGGAAGSPADNDPSDPGGTGGTGGGQSARTAVEITAMPVNDGSGRPRYAALLVRDVTAANLARAEREALTTRFELILERMPVGCIVNGADFRFTYWNPAAERMFGYRLDEVEGRHPFDTITPQHAQAQVRDLFDRLAAGDVVVDGIGDNITKDGRPLRCEWHNSMLRDAAGQFVGVLSMCRDVTDELARQAERDALTTRLQSLLERMPTGCVVTDEELRFTYWNPAAEHVFGYRFEQVEGRSPFQVMIAPDDRNAVRAEFDQLIAGTDVIDSIREHTTNDGRTILCQWRNTALRNADGEFLGIMAMCEDVTAQHERDAQLAQAQKMEAVGQLTGGIAHDFNNLLTIIIGNLELARLRDRSSATNHAVDTATRAAIRGAELVQRLLAFARRQVLEPNPVVLAELVEDVIPLLHRTLDETIVVDTRLAGTWQTIVDRSQLENGLVNLVINARDAMPTGGTLTIETGDVTLDDDYCNRNPGVAPGDYAMLAVTDTGTGMSQHVAEQALDPFFTTKDPGQGSGLGLPTTYGFVKQSGGHLTIQSEPERGTKVQLYLPRGSASATTPAGPAVDVSLPGGRETVLVVEDEREVRELAARHLEALGYRVLEAENGPAAVAVLDSGEPVDLLLTDVVMPGGMTGYELAAWVGERRPELRVLYTTGYADHSFVRREVLGPGARVLGKPYRRSELARQVRDALDADRAAP